MLGLTPIDRRELERLRQTEGGEGWFDGLALDRLEAAGRIERYDVVPDGTYSLRVTEAGMLALRVCPIVQAL